MITVIKAIVGRAIAAGVRGNLASVESPMVDVVVDFSVFEPSIVQNSQVVDFGAEGRRRIASKLVYCGQLGKFAW